MDLVLFELRLFKSRSLASVAIQDGAALLNGALVKPSRNVHAGDRVTLSGPAASRTLEILALPRGSLSKESARALVREISSA